MTRGPDRAARPASGRGAGPPACEARPAVIAGAMPVRPVLLSLLALGLAVSGARAEFRRAVRVEPAALGACILATLNQRHPARVRYGEPAGPGVVRLAAEERSTSLFGLGGTSPAFVMEIRRTGRGAEVAIVTDPAGTEPDAHAARTWREIDPCLPAGP